jgi:vesicle-fusing ATPase
VSLPLVSLLFYWYSLSRAWLTRPSIAVAKVKPAFGSREDELRGLVQHGIINFNPTSLSHTIQQISELSRAIGSSEVIRKAVVLFHGPTQSGTTALATDLALRSGFSFVRVITPKSLLTFKGESAKVDHLTQTFADAERSKQSVIVLDEVETLINWAPLGNPYSITILSALRALLSAPVPHDRHQLVFVTTSNFDLMARLGLTGFDRKFYLPPVTDLSELEQLLRGYGGSFTGREQWACSQIQHITDSRKVGLGIKSIMFTLGISKEASGGNPAKEVEHFIDLVSEDIRRNSQF